MTATHIAVPLDQNDERSPALTSNHVEQAFRSSLAENVEGAIVIEGIVHKVAFDPGRVAGQRDAVVAMIADLQDEFITTRGGGWSFLNLCMDRHGNQWTGLHLAMEQLCMLAIALELGRWVLPKELWSALPGGMPYVQFDQVAA